MNNSYQTPYDYLGDEGVRRLVDAFYDAMDALPEAAEVRAMHAKDLTKVRKALTNYLTTWLGGPPVYVAIKGSMCLTDAHAPFVIGPNARDQWLLCMEHALEQTAAPADLRDMLREPLSRVADAVQNSPTDAPSMRIIARG